MTAIETTPTNVNAVDIAAVAGLAGKIQESPEVASTTWNAKVQWHEGFRSTASVRDFAPIHSDEPASLGAATPAQTRSSNFSERLAIVWPLAMRRNATAAGIEINDLSIELER